MDGERGERGMREKKARREGRVTKEKGEVKRGRRRGG